MKNENNARCSNINSKFPRFVFEKVEIPKNKYPPKTEKEFDWYGRRLKLIIAPARLDEDDKITWYYPRKQDEIVENALQQLLLKNNLSYKGEKFVLYTNLTEIQDEIANSSKTILDIYKIEKSLEILASVTYTLIENNSQRHHRLIESSAEYFYDNGVI